MPEKSKYQIWHDRIINRARGRKPLGGYSESHHILPRSLGGADVPSNLVALTYREHFLVHWLLTRIEAGGARRCMQQAMIAVTMNLAGRAVKCWQMDIARMVASDLEVDPEFEAAWKKRYHAKKKQEKREARAREAGRPELRRVSKQLVRATLEQPTNRPNRYELGGLASLWLKGHSNKKSKHVRLRGSGAIKRVRRAEQQETTNRRQTSPQANSLA